MQKLLALKEEVAQNIVTVEKVDELIIANNKVALDLLSKIEASDEAQTAQINKITAVLNGVVPEEEVEVVEEEVTPAVDEPVITEPVAETEQTA